MNTYMDIYTYNRRDESKKETNKERTFSTRIEKRKNIIYDVM